MKGFNFLPWREQQREESNRQFVRLLIAIIFAGVFVVVFSHTLIAEKIQKQQSVNNFLSMEAKKLGQDITEIKGIKERKKEVIQRLQLIHELQKSRPRIVKAYDELVRVIPPGLHIKTISRKGNILTLKGNAQSNLKVSELMKKIEQSKWFANPQLQEVKVDAKQNDHNYAFTLKLSLFSDAAKTKGAK